MKRILALLLVSLMVIASFAGCQPKAKETPTEEKTEATTAAPEVMGSTELKWNIGSDPKTLDPILGGASDSGNVVNNTFEGLVREKAGVVYPGIAESWTVSEDGLTLTFKLRESKWSDGTPLTANDFVYSFKRGMDPKTASEYAWIWEYTNIVGAFDATTSGNLDAVGVKALDDYTLELKLSTPTEYLVSLLSFYHFKPVKQASVDAKADGAWAKDPALAVSNGPFTLTAYEIGKGLTLTKNPNYWDAGNVKLETIVATFIDEASTAYQAFESGELQFIPQVPTAEVPRLIAEDPQFHIFPLLGTYYYNFNLKKEFFADPKVRRAFNLAIDRELICETMGAGQMPAVSFVPAGFIDADGKDFNEVAGDLGLATDLSKLEEAKKLMAEAGYPDGKGFPEFTIMYNTSEGHKLVAELVQEMLKTNLGLSVKLENQEWAVFQDTRKAGNYEVARGGWLTDFMDPSGLLSIFTKGNAYNDPKFENAEYDKLLSASAKTRGKEHFDNLYKAQEILMAELPILPVYHYTETMLVKENLVGWERSVLGTIDFSMAYFNK